MLFNSKKKILLIQFKRSFNSIVKESLILVENCPKSSKIDKKRVFSSKMANIDSKYDSLIVIANRNIGTVAVIVEFFYYFRREMLLNMSTTYFGEI